MPNCKTLIDVILKEGKNDTRGITFINENNNEKFVTYKEVYENALRILKVIQDCGVKQGDELIFQIDEDESFIYTAWACILGGIVAVPISAANMDEYRSRIFHVFNILKKPFLITTENRFNDLQKFGVKNKISNKLQQSMAARSILIDRINDKMWGFGDISIAQPSNIVFIMFSSGSTGEPKGVKLTHENILTEIRAVKEPYKLSNDDKILSWMPLTHILGMNVSHLLPLTISANQYIMSKTLFIGNPLTWLEKVNEHRITAICSPDFGFKYVMEEIQHDTDYHWDLSCIRVAIDGGELISKSVLDGFVKKMKRYRLNEKAICPAYGMSESCMGISTKLIDEEIQWYALDREHISIGDKVKELDIGDQRANIFVNTGNVLDCCRVRICDDNDQILEEGRIGNIQFTGSNMTEGYYNNENSKEAYTKDGWFNTGDVGFLKNDRLIITGRTKDILIANGQNYYAYDIERVAQEVPGVKLTAACSVFDQFNEKEQIILFVLYPQEIDKFITIADEINRKISSKIGLELKYIIPVSEIPRNGTGKVQRYKLKDMYLQGAFDENLKRMEELIASSSYEQEYTAPNNDIGEKLVEIFQKVLKVRKIGIEDNFFALGGNSLKAIKLIALIHRELNVEIPVSELFNNSTVRLLEKYIEIAQKSTCLSIEIAPEKEVYEVAAVQKRLYALSQFSDGKTNYNIPCVLTVEGELEKEKVERIFRQIIERHEALRTSFELDSEEIVQRIHRKVEFNLQYTEINEAEDYTVTEIVRSFIKPFDLSKAPLIRAKLIRIRKDKHILVLDMHHIISDGTTLGIVIKEFSRLYKGEKLENLQIQYKDFAAWQNKQLSSEAIKKQEKYWEGVFSDGVPVLNFPTDYKRPAKQSFDGDSIVFKINREMSERVKSLAKTNGVTLYMTLLSIYSVLLSKYCRQEDIIVGSAMAGRMHTELQGIVGMFVNTVVIRNKVNGKKSFREMLQEVKKVSLDAYENQEYPFDKLINKLAIKKDPSRNAMFDTMFILQNMDIEGMDNDTIRIKQLRVKNNISKFDFTLSAEEIGEEIEFNLEYCTKLFRKETMERLSGYYQNILVQVLQHPEIKVSDIELLTSGEKKKILVDFNSTKLDYPSDKTICELFEEQVQRTPGGLAVAFEDKRLTYGDLNEKASALSKTLQARGVKAGTIVGIIAERSLEMIVGILGILKAGGAYLPVDPELPKDRIKYMFEDSGVNIVLTTGRISNIPEYYGLMMDLQDKDAYSYYDEAFSNISSPKDLAYVIYTSGSTGRPKGVMVENRNVVNLVFAMKEALYDSYERKLNISMVSPYYFDASVKQIFPALLLGHTLYIVPKDLILDGEGLIRYYENNLVDIADGTPAHLSMLVNLDSKANKSNWKVDTFIIGGEALPARLVNEIIDTMGTKIMNVYGPTECCDVATRYFITDKIDNSQSLVPIGRPLANVKVYILTDKLEICPIGVNGEIFIGGQGVTRGYLCNEKLTNEKFISNPFETEGKMYRTGDLGRWLADGNIEYLGRIDSQVKIRGYRVELGEIENQLLQNEEVKEATVIEKEDKEGNYYLCAYIVSDREIVISQLRERLLKKLPNYMIPAYFKRIKEIPLTANGKVDRKALSEPEGGICTGIEYVAPRNIVENKLLEMWIDVLETEKVGIDDDFFMLGGHSLKAIQLMTRIHREFDVMIPIKDLFSNATIRKLGEYIKNSNTTVYSPINQIERKEFYETTPQQKRMFTLNQVNDNQVIYNMPDVIIIEGKLEKSKVEEAFRNLIERHEILRTSFELSAKKIVQRVHEKVEFNVEYTEINKIKEFQVEDILRDFVKPFDLSIAPLIRVRLIRIDDEKYILMFDMHHIISDGVSIGIIKKEFSKLYLGEKLNKPTLQYRDYAAWHNEMLESEKMKKQGEYWKEIFNGEIPILNIPTDYMRPIFQSHQGESISFNVNKELTEKLKKIGIDSGATLYMCLLSIYSILLSKHSGQDDIIVGSPIANRVHADLKNVVGMFVNTIVMRNKLDSNQTFIEFLEQVKKNVLNAYENQEYPFDKLIEELHIKKDLSRNPLFDTMFVLQNTDQEEMIFKDIKYKSYKIDSNSAKFDITMSAKENSTGIEFCLEYCTRLFKKETIERLIEHFKNILKEVSEKPELKLSQIEMLSKEEKKQILLEFNNTKAEYPRNITIYELFEKQVEATPDNIAVVCGNEKITYRELNNRSNSLAVLLREKGIKADNIIGIMTEASLEMLVGIVAILKAGGAYMPVDPNYPKERIEYMLKDSNSGILLTQKHLIENVDFKGYIVDLNDKKLYQGNSRNLDKTSKANDLAYVIYTSGSTGKPKGVMIEHRALVNFSLWYKDYYEINENDRTAKYAGVGFDASVSEMFPYMISGASIYVVDPSIRLNIAELNKYYETNKISITFLPTQICEQFMRVKNRSLRKLLTGGDKTKTYIKQSYDVVDNYGPTENTVVTTTFIIDKQYNNIPIGKPISNNKIYILDKNNNICSIGVIGEICIGGYGLARGYMNRPQLTAEKFVPNPFEPGERMYRTGDLGMWLNDGNIELAGRIDYQVKIRGLRIELGEIENQLLKQNGIKEAVVIDRIDKQNNKYLCAYIVSDISVIIEDIKEGLSKELPDYMVPAYFVQMENLPLTPNGKVDRRALPEPNVHSNIESEYEAPRNEIEKSIEKVWNEILGIEKIGINDDFFQLGGNSLNMLYVLSKLSELKIKINVKYFMEHPTIKELGRVAKVDSNNNQQEKIVKGEVPLLPNRALLDIRNLKNDVNHWNIGNMFEVSPLPTKEQIESVIRYLLNHHDGLRLRLYKEGTEWKQYIRDMDDKLPITYIDFSNIEDALMKDAIESKVEEFQKSSSLDKCPVRVVVFNLGSNRPGRILTLVHHGLSDGYSISIFLQDFSTVYSQVINGEKPCLPYKTTSIKRWSEYLKDYAQSENVRKELGYWTEGAKEINHIPLDFPDEIENNYFRFERVLKNFLLTEEETKILYTKVLNRDTQINDILITALLRAIERWTGYSEVLMDYTFSGRYPLNKDINLSRTIGWLGFLVPVYFNFTGKTDLRGLFNFVRDRLHNIPSGGLGYGCLRYLCNDTEVLSKMNKIPYPEITYNYFKADLQQKDFQKTKLGYIKFANESAGQNEGDDINRGRLIDFVAGYSENRLRLKIQYSCNIHKEETMKRLFSYVKEELDIILKELTDTNL